MKRKFISFLTVLALILTMMPMQVYGEEAVPDAPNAIISLAEIAGVSAPVKGETPVASIADTDEYTATIAWSGAPDVFAADTEYTATIEITPKTGYTLEGLPENFFKVAGADASNAAGSGTVTAVFPKTALDEPVTPEPTPDAAISIAVISGVLEPVKGETPVASLPGSAEYSASITWNDNPVVFEPDTAYTATITITPLAGFTLTGVPANFFTVEGATATNDAGSGVITAVFPQTGSASTITVSAIEGVIPPATDAAPVTTLPGSGQFSATVTWSGITTSVFEANTTYTAIITITPFVGYTLTGVPANFFTVEGATATNDAGSGVITAVFPQTGPANPPELAYAATSEEGDLVVLVFDKEMASPSALDAENFSVQVNGDDNGTPVIYPITVSGIFFDPDSSDAIVLVLDESIQRGDIVTVGYSPGTVAAANGMALEAFADEYVINQVPIKIVSDLEGTWWYSDHVGWWGEDKDYVEPDWDPPAPPYFLTGDDDPRGVAFNRHIVTNGNKVIFYGYGAPGYKDFLYLPSEDDAAKSFYFDLDLGQIKYHSMEGGGFLFNTEIVYDQVKDKEYISGYCVLFTAVAEYVEGSEVTRYVAKLYQLDEIDVGAFAEGLYPYDTLEGSPAGSGITLLNTVDLPEGDLHSFTLEVSSSTVDLWDGAAKLIDTLVLPDDDTGNGVGVIASYKDHGCSELSYFIFSSLSIEGIANLSAVLDGTEADLTFTAPTGATSVKVEQSKDGINFVPSSLLSPITATDTTATVTGLDPDTTYFFRLSIQGGQYEGYSRVATALYTGPIKNLTALPDDGKAKLTFSPPIGATKVEVLQSEDGGLTFTPAAIQGDLGPMPTSATVVGLANGKQYWFKLVVTGGANDGESNLSSVTPAIQTQPHSSGGGGSSKPVAKNIFRFEIGDTNSYLTSGSAIEKKILMDTAPIIYEDRTLLPIRFVVEPLGGTVAWDEKEQKVTITLDKTTIELWIGNNTAKVNGVEKLIDPLNKNVVPIIVDPGRTMLPLRFISESLGCTVDWDAVNKKITVTDWDK